MFVILQQHLWAARASIRCSIGPFKLLKGCWSGHTFYKELVIKRKGCLCSKPQSAWNLLPFHVAPHRSPGYVENVGFWPALPYSCAMHSHSCATILIMHLPNSTARPDINPSPWLSWLNCVYSRMAAKRGSTLSSWSAINSSQPCWNKWSTALRQGPQPLLVHSQIHQRNDCLNRT